MNKIALVGCTGSSFDAIVLSDVIRYLKVDLSQYYIDPIDLKNNRDFLKEDKEYDIVVLFYIFKIRYDELNEYEKFTFQYHSDCNTSDLHTKENWCNRLLKSKASHILVFGSELNTEVNYKYIGDLEDYKTLTVKFPGGLLWHYVKDAMVRELLMENSKESIVHNA